MMAKNYLDKKMALAIKGIALILMFVHHFFTWPSWYVEGISYPQLRDFALYMEKPTRICVSVFAFLTGYVYFFAKEKNYRYSIRKITDLLLSYWSVYIPLLLFAVFAGDYQLNGKGFARELFALSVPVMMFCWYVTFYCLVMLLLPLITRLSRNHPVADTLVLVLILPLALLFGSFFVRLGVIHDAFAECCRWLPCVMMGFVFAKYELFERILDRMVYWFSSKVIRIFIWICLLCIAMAGRNVFPQKELIKRWMFDRQIYMNLNMDIVYAPLFVYSAAKLLGLLKNGLLLRIFVSIGKMSLYMWFVHCIFFNVSAEKTQRLLYMPGDPVLVLLWGLALCYMAALMFDAIVRPVQKWKNERLFAASK